MAQNRQLRLLEALRQREQRQRPFSLDELVEATGYKLSTLKTYTTKRLRGTLIFEDEQGLLTCRGALAITPEAFLRRLDQRRATSELSAEDRLVDDLCARSHEHLLLALTLYHRPGARSGVEVFCHHIGRAWTLLLLAALVGDEPESVAALLRGQLGDPAARALSMAFDDPDDPVRRNIALIGDLERASGLAPLGHLQGPLSRLFQASVLNYGQMYRRVTGDPVVAGGLSGVLSESPPPDLARLGLEIGAAAEALGALLRRFEAEEAELQSPRFATPAGYRWQLAPIGEALPIDLDEDLEATTAPLDLDLQRPLFENPLDLQRPLFEDPPAPSTPAPPEEPPGPAPETIEALLALAFEGLQEGDRRLLERRVLEGAPLVRLEAEHGMGAEALRGRLGEIVDRLHARWEFDAARLTSPLLQAIQANGGLVHQTRVEALTGTSDLRRAALALAMAGASGVRRWRDEFLTRLPPEDFARRLGQLGDALRGQREARLPILRVMSMSNEIAGFSLARPAFERLLAVAFRMVIGEDDRVVVRRTRTDRLLKLMAAEDKPLHFVEIVDLYTGAHPDEGESEEAEAEPGDQRALEASLEAILRAHEDIYALGRETWVHRAALPIAPGRLDEIVAWCVEFMEGLTGAITPQKLLGELDRVGKDRRGLNAALLRDALSRHSDVVTFKNESLVAHVESFREGGLTLDEALERILLQCAEPLSLPQVLELLPEGVNFHRTAVHASLLTSPWAISLGRGRFDHIDDVGLDEPRRRRLIDMAVASLPEDGSPMSCRALLDEINPMEPGLGGGRRSEALAILWGLLHKDERAQCGPGGQVARSRDEGARALLQAAIVEVLEDLEVAHIRQLRIELTARYGHGGMESAFRGLLSDCVEAGLIKRLPGRLYVLNPRGQEQT